MNMSVHLNLPAILAGIVKLRAIITALIVIAIFGFTLYQISLVASTEPDAEYLAKKQEDQGTTRIKLDQSVTDYLKQRQTAGDQAPNIETGKTDPFRY